SNFKKRTLKKNLEFADRITVTSSALKEQTEKFIQPTESIKVIPFGIDLDLFEVTYRDDDKDEICIGTIKSLKKIYGIDILLRATAQLISYLRTNHYEQLADKIRLTIVGKGPELAHLQDLAEKLNISRITEFVGSVPNEQVPEQLKNLDVYCAFSESESFGVAVLEASACEVPVIVSNVGGLPEVVQDEQTGFIVNTEHEDEIVEKLYQLIISTELRGKLGKNARKFVKDAYKWQHNVTQMENIYSKYE